MSNLKESLEGDKKVMLRFFADIRKYVYFCFYSAKTNLKAEVADSYLNWIWWILEPLCNMLIYYFVFGNLLGNTGDYFVSFIYIGLIMWNFFNRIVLYSVKAVRSNKAIISRVYIPKFILLFSNMILNAIKTLFSVGILVVLLVIQGVSLNWRMLYAIPIACVLCIWTFGFASIVLHFGVFVDDLTHVITIMLSMLFMLTGIFYDLETRIAAPFGRLLLSMNPVAVCISSMRNVLIYNKNPHFLLLGIWSLVSVIFAVIGVKIIYYYENTYAKVV